MAKNVAILVSLAASAWVALAPAPAGAAEKGKMRREAPVVMQIGAPVPLSRCEKAPHLCICPPHARGIQYRSGNLPQYVCINTRCEEGKTLRVRSNAKGVKEGSCVSGGGE